MHSLDVTMNPAMPICTLCNRPALYYDLRLRAMACAQHAGSDVQVAAVRSLTAALLKALAWEGVVDPEQHGEIQLIIERLKPLLRD